MEERSKAAVDIARQGGAVAVEFYNRVGELVIEDKGPQDFVSEADTAVEHHIRQLIDAAFPEDGIVGEEDAPKPSKSGYTWVLDPIDGTTNFISSIPVWTVVIAIVKDDQTQIGVIHDPLHDELFHAARGLGAQLNGRALTCPADASLTRGSVSTGFSNKISRSKSMAVINAVLAEGGIFHRNASGALSLAYVAAGRLIGYVEQHMNAWDCLAGQLIVQEAGGRIEDQSANAMIAQGGRVVAGSAGVFDDLVRIADAAYAD